MHLKKSEVQIGVESSGFSTDFNPAPLLEIRISSPISEDDAGFQSSKLATVHGFPSASTPHKRPIMNQQAILSNGPQAYYCPISKVCPPISSSRRILHRLPFSFATQLAICRIFRLLRFRLRLVFLLCFPSLYLLLVSFSSSSLSPSSRRFFITEFFSAVAFSSAILFLLSISLNSLSFPSVRLLLSRSFSLFSRYHLFSRRPVQFFIGSEIGKPKSYGSIDSGFCVQVYSSGDVFEGELYKGKCSGSGVYYYYMSGRYEGDWVDSKYDGYGIETWAKGSRYKGKYRQSLRHGFGVYRFYTGDVYAGEWLNGESHGCGLQTCADGSRYVGEFKQGIKHGLGHYHFRNGDTYAGEYFADKMHGYGVYNFANGHRYEGSWHEGLWEGLGMYIFRNGQTRAGHWQSGVLSLLNTCNTHNASPIGVNLSKVLNAVQEARRAADRAFNLPKVDGKVKNAVAYADKAANAARVAAVKAVQKKDPPQCRKSMWEYFSVPFASYAIKHAA